MIASIPHEAPVIPELRRAPRIAVFTHDTYGLGHVRRCWRILHALAERSPQATSLLITGSPALDLLKTLPERADYLKLPTIVRTGAEGSKPSHLRVTLKEISRIRSSLIKEAIGTFSPDLFLVDNFPLGSRRELLPALREAQVKSIRTVLGLRDIVDSPEVVRSDWSRNHIYEVLEQYYDRILIYGMPQVLNAVDAYALPHQISDKLLYTGYVTGAPRGQRKPELIREELGMGGSLLVATVGGGGDGLPLLEVVIQAMHYLPDMSAVIIEGPLMGSEDRRTLRTQAAGNPNIRIIDQVSNLSDYLAAADVVVSMCGYNIAAELVNLSCRAVIVPRTWRYGEHARREEVTLEWEQILRARALKDLGLVEMVEPGELTPIALANRVRALREQPSRADGVSVDLGGLVRVVTEILNLIYEREPADVRS